MEMTSLYRLPGDAWAFWPGCYGITHTTRVSNEVLNTLIAQFGSIAKSCGFPVKKNPGPNIIQDAQRANTLLLPYSFSDTSRVVLYPLLGNMPQNVLIDGRHMSIQPRLLLYLAVFFSKAEKERADLNSVPCNVQPLRRRVAAPIQSPPESISHHSENLKNATANNIHACLQDLKSSMARMFDIRATYLEPNDPKLHEIFREIEQKPYYLVHLLAILTLTHGISNRNDFDCAYNKLTAAVQNELTFKRYSVLAVLNAIKSKINATPLSEVYHLLP